MKVEKIVELYKNIDSEIEQLHHLSTNDFSMLNETFKNNYNKSKEFYDLQKQLILSIQKFIPVSLSGNQVIDREFNHLRQIIQKRIINISTGLDKSQKIMDSILVPLKNYKQNILTINFILSQLTVIKNYSKASSKNETSEINRLFKGLNELFNSFLQKIEDLKTKIEINNQQLNTYKLDINKQISVYASTLKNTVEYLKNKQINIDEYSYKINYDEIIREKSNEIIVNLQYHDIIRQKMDHVQQTYKEFLIEILDKQNNNNSNENILLPYMANLADLQSAQLTHVNKQYQEAIKSINSSLFNISDVVHQHTKEVEQLINASDGLSFPEKILTDIQSAKPENTKLGDYVNSSVDVVNQVSFDLSECIKEFNQIKHENNELIKWIKDIIFKSGPKSILNENLYLQLINVSNETTRFAKEINKSLAKNQQLISNLTSTNFNVTQNLDLYRDNLEDYFKLYYDIINEIKEITNKTSIISKGINADKENVANSLRYYEYFENTIQKLIDELAVINDEAISKGVSISSDELKKQFENIKHLYTMNSERLIHNKISDIESDQIISTIEEDEDSVEFF